MTTLNPDNPNNDERAKRLISKLTTRVDADPHRETMRQMIAAEFEDVRRDEREQCARRIASSRMAKGTAIRVEAAQAFLEAENTCRAGWLKSSTMTMEPGVDPASLPGTPDGSQSPPSSPAGSRPPEREEDLT